MRDKKTFTTGEVAKLCNTSVRTVQFYDREGIVSPSETSEGGRRIYTESDVDRFRLACLYRNLGFSLGEVKGMAAAGSERETLLGLLSAQQKKMEDKIADITGIKDKLIALQEEIRHNGMANISSDEELNGLLIKKGRHRKTDIITWVLLISFIAVTITGLLLTVQIGGAYPFIMIGVIIALLAALIYYHSSVNAYVCPSCGEKFVIGFFKDVFSPNGVTKGKLLKCPHCQKRAWIRDTYKDE